MHGDYTDFLNGNVTSLQVIGNGIFIRGSDSRQVIASEEYPFGSARPVLPRAPLTGTPRPGGETVV